MIKAVIKYSIQNKSTSILKGRFLHSYQAVNEPILDYKRESLERKNLQKTLVSYLELNDKKGDCLFDVPIVIGDKEFRTNNVRYQLVPFEHGIKLAKFYYADKKMINDAIENNLSVRAEWENSSFEFRSGIFLKAADILANAKRPDILASTMLGQGKTVFQAGWYLYICIF